MTAEMRADLVAMRVHFGVSATEALRGMPAWEFDLLTEALPHRRQATIEQEELDGEEEFNFDGQRPSEPQVPAALRGL